MKTKRYSLIALLIPLASLAILLLSFFYKLNKPDNSVKINSAIIGREAPQLTYYELGDNIPFSLHDFKGKFILVNIWASWCIPCHQEVPILQQLKNEKDIIIVGLNYRDEISSANNFIKKYNHLFDYSARLTNSKEVVAWGIFGIPESFLIDREGKIIYKKLGPLTEEDLKQDIYVLLAE